MSENNCIYKEKDIKNLDISFINSLGIEKSTFNNFLEELKPNDEHKKLFLLNFYEKKYNESIYYKLKEKTIKNIVTSEVKANLQSVLDKHKKSIQETDNDNIKTKFKSISNDNVKIIRNIGNFNNINSKIEDLKKDFDNVNPYDKTMKCYLNDNGDINMDIINSKKILELKPFEYQYRSIISILEAEAI